MRWRGASGFNLTEALIAIAIVAILITAAIPQYRKTVDRNYRQQAQDILMTIYYGEQAYKVTNNKFIAPGTNWNAIFMDNPHVGDPSPVTFVVTSESDTTFTATATRAAASSPCGGKTMTINKEREVGGSWLTCP